jgi:3-hydroxyacyl-CoA dehydrogenase/enoyl-CoA hydratase/3-hydroxybutyryl-CoA epimerase
MLYETVHVRLSNSYGMATLAVDLAADPRAALEHLFDALQIVHGRPGTSVLLLRGFARGLGGPFSGIADGETAELGQRVAQQIARASPITVAWIDGPCLGGALELALACDYRVAVGSATTRLGLPQVAAGSIPCWGGAVRLPRLIGLEVALDLMLDGLKLSAGQALAMGLIDRAFGPRMARVSLDHFLLDLQSRGAKPRHRRRRSWRWRQVLNAATAHWTAAVSGEHRAVFAAIQILAAACAAGSIAGFAAERAAANELATRDRTQFTDMPASRGYLSFERVAVVGGGTVGAALAQWASLHGSSVVVCDRDPNRAREHIRRQFRSASAKRLVPAEEVEQKLREVVCTDRLDVLAEAQLVIEATTESQSRKRAVLREIESVVRSAAVIATTSTVLPVSSLSETLSHPERFLGLHVAHPAAAQRCVELTAGPRTDPLVVARVKSWLRGHGKIAVQTADRPGRVVGRVMLPYFHEALLLATEGARVADIDSAMQRFGFAWGPFAAMDEVGLDIVRANLRGLKVVYGDDLIPPTLIKRLTKRGWLGRKSGAGFYIYDRGERRVHSEALPRPPKRSHPSDGVMRLVARLVNAAYGALTLQMSDDATIDGLIVAAGWPAFRGGPIQYAESRGLRRFVRQLERLANQYGERFAPSPALLSAVPERRRWAA